MCSMETWPHEDKEKRGGRFAIQVNRRMSLDTMQQHGHDAVSSLGTMQQPRHDAVCSLFSEQPGH